MDREMEYFYENILLTQERKEQESTSKPRESEFMTQEAEKGNL